MKVKSIIQIVLAAAILALAWFLYSSIQKPVKFQSEFDARRNACAEKLKAIRTLEESYKMTYNVYCGSFDTLINRLMNEDSLLITKKTINYDKIPEDVSVNDMPETEAIKLGYISLEKVFVNPIEQLLEQKKLMVTDPDGAVRPMTKDEIMNLRYVPFPKGEKNEFELTAGTIESNSFIVPVFECKVPLTVLLSDLDDQLVRNRIAEIEAISGKYAGWKVGDMTQAVTEGNFE